ncbi:hypothetical protein EDEG_01423 [Edhazardia aedis USNM 41457]|uniref:Uncharacterized protein n=1 Tax=Edhazardia aedis (strain USNM 41457) TaxID=1003232 RepID=J9D9W3_EDHAE|nr:hypothetical protein EDEG_01423 [Edhazardia aedis USNM 41457]|eukprot:EJW04299.1 hypothetical protein EDEG_01423 [Edhazardia aedis USNM 41457]
MPPIMTITIHIYLQSATLRIDKYQRKLMIRRRRKITNYHRCYDNDENTTGIITPVLTSKNHEIDTTSTKNLFIYLFTYKLLISKSNRITTGSGSGFGNTIIILHMKFILN